MKILCDRQQLTEVFGVAAGIAPVKTPKPIAKNVLVQAKGDALSVLATDFEMSARVTLEAVKVKEAGTALLPAREAHALLRELGDPTVTLESSDFRCKIESGGGSFVLVEEDPAQFPQQILLEQGTAVTVPAQQFLDMLRRTSFAAAKDDSRYAINGVLIQVRGDSVRLVATDGRRLALCYHHIEDQVPEAELLVPLRALQALTRAIPEGGEDDLTIHFSPRQAGFSVKRGGGETLLVSQLLDRRFPDYEGVIPKAADTTVEIPRGLLEANVRRVAVLSSGDVRLVRFQFGSSTLELSAESSGVGRADVVLDVDVKGPGGAISFNPDYVLEALRVTEQDVVRIDMTDEETPAKFTLGEAFTYVLMPISNG